jgi:TRAP-type C4-dicarboxylate transport system substrate-binding protein
MNWRETWLGSCSWRPMIFSRSDRYMPRQPLERRRRQLLAQAVRIFLAVHVLPLAFGGPSLAEASQTIKIGTLAPEGSSWVTALRAIDRDLRSQTDGELKLKIYPGGVQGDEDVMIRKLRIGQLHAGGFGGKGVSDIFADALALETPFLFNGYDEIDYVLEQMAKF